MSKTYIALCDFTPRTTGELRISKYDHILISDVGNGWAWGKNLTQGGEGTFPRRYLATSRSSSSGLKRATDEVAIVFSQVDQLIGQSAYLISEGHRASLRTRQTKLREFGSFWYLSSGCTGGIWEECLHNFVSAFHDTKVKAHEYLRCVENLRRLSGLLDSRLPVLIEEIRKYTRVQPSILRNVECMQATLKGLVNIATEAFKLYRPKEPVKACPLRLDSHSLTSLSGSTLRIITSINRSGPLPVPSPIHPTTSSSAIQQTALGYPTLQALTILTCIVACCLQFRSYALSPHSRGGIGEPDFYGNLQSVLMQLMTTYTGLVPTIRSKSVRGLVSVFWVALLSVAGVVLNLVAIGIYFDDEGMAPLLGFFGNVVQAIVVLQLAMHIESQPPIDNEYEMPSMTHGV